MTDKRELSPVIAHLTQRERFGSQTRLAEAAGVKPHTISGKADTQNPLTYAQMRRILDAGPRMGIPVTPSDFFPDVAGQEPTKTAEAA